MVKFQIEKWIPDGSHRDRFVPGHWQVMHAAEAESVSWAGDFAEGFMCGHAGMRVLITIEPA